VTLLFCAIPIEAAGIKKYAGRTRAIARQESFLFTIKLLTLQTSAEENFMWPDRSRPAEPQTINEKL
jgi:hypothetical protein